MEGNQIRLNESKFCEQKFQVPIVRSRSSLLFQPFLFFKMSKVNENIIRKGVDWSIGRNFICGF